MDFEMIRTFAVLGIFVVLAIFNITNIIRHHREKKDQEAQKKREGFKVARDLKGDDNK